MAVNDHGIEAIRKAAEQARPGDQTNYYIKTGLFDRDSQGAPYIAPSGALEVATLRTLVGSNFESGAFLAHEWLTAATGSGTVTQVNGEAVLSTGTTADSRAAFQTMRRARFRGGTFNKTHQAWRFPSTDNPDVVRRLGFWDPVTPVVGGATNGVFLENDGGAWRMVRLRGGVEDDVQLESEFNGGNALVKGDGISVFEFQYNAGNITLFQNRKRITFMAAPQTVAYNTTHIPVAAEIFNKNGNTTDNTFGSRANLTLRVGRGDAVAQPFMINSSGTGVIKTSPATVNSLLITDSGAGSASVTLWDSATPGVNPIGTFSASSKENFPLGFETSNGLSYTATGSGFEVLVIYD